MNGEKQIVIGLLEGLGDCVEFPFVRAGVVRLALSGNGADKIAMHSHSEANHIDCFLNVGLPIAALLGIVYLGDYDIMLLLAVGRDVECGEPGFAGVLRAGEKVQNGLFLGDNALLLLAAVGDALGTKYGFPIFRRDFDLVFYGGGVFELRLLCNAYELLDVVPFSL